MTSCSVSVCQESDSCLEPGLLNWVDLESHSQASQAQCSQSINGACSHFFLMERTACYFSKDACGLSVAALQRTAKFFQR